MGRLWIVPRNDGESVEIRRLLDECHEPSLVTLQPWGANWAGLEPEVLKALERSSAQILGIELSGAAPSNAVNIDHHDYPGDSRWKPLSSLEQIARILGSPLSRWRSLVAANDRGYIPAMESMNAGRPEIEAVRQFDRRAQKVSRRMELDAWKVIRKVEPVGALWRVQVPGPTHSAYADLLYTVCKAREWLLESPVNWAYSGPRHRDLMALSLPENHWSGGGAESGYFGVANPSQPSQRLILGRLQ